MPSPTTPLRALSLDPAKVPEGHVIAFRLGAFYNARQRSTLCEAWAFDLLDLPIGHGFAHGAEEERVEAFYVRPGSREHGIALGQRDGRGPSAVEPSAGRGCVWSFTAHARPYAQRWDAQALSLTAWALPIGGWLRQGYACERIRRVAVEEGGSDYRAAVSNEGSAHSHRMRERFGGDEPPVE